MSGVGSTAMRLRRPRWKDPRLIVGIVLVLASVLAGAFVTSRLAETTTVLVAREDIVVGDVLSADSLGTAQLRLGDRADLYAASFDEIPDGAVATRTISRGELLPTAAIGQSKDVPLRPVVIPVNSSVAASVVPGGTVELWRTPDAGGADAAAPRAELLVEDAVVRSVDSGSSLGMRSMTVEVLVPAERLPDVLEALAAEDRVDVIGVPGARGTSP